MFTNILNRNDCIITRACIANSPYVLMLYILSSSMEEICSTLFFVSDGISQDVLKRLNNVIYYKTEKLSRFLLYWYIFKERFQLLNKYPFINHLDVFGADHLSWSSIVLNGKKMTLIGDGLALYSPPGVPSKNILVLFLKKIFRVIEFPHGRGNHCHTIIHPVGHNYEDNAKRIISLNTKEEFLKNIDKKKFILYLFNITQEDIDNYDDKKIIILTQPLLEEGFSEEDIVDLYKSQIRKYEQSKIIIKKHPRDYIDYSAYFPNISISDKQIPLELLVAIGVDFDIAITYSSWAIYCLPSSVKKIILSL